MANENSTLQSEHVPTLSARMLEIAKTLMTQSPIVRWRDVLSALPKELGESEQKEAQREGLQKLAKWAVKSAQPDPTSLFGWARMNMPDADGARITAFVVTVEHYDWLITQIDRAISNFTKRRVKLVAERDALVQRDREIQ